MRTFFLGLLMLALAGCAGDADLLQRVRAGGVTLYMRHAATVSTQDQPGGVKRDYADCSWQRGLSDKGREQAREVAAVLPRLALPIKSVVASPMCRAMDTARIAFGTAAPDNALRGRTAPDGSFDVAPIVDFFKRAVPPGSVFVVVGHEHPSLAFEPMLREGEAAVIRGSGDNYEVVGRIPPEMWARWARL